MDAKIFWLGMFVIWIISIILMLVEKSRVGAILIAIIGIMFFMLYRIENKIVKKEG
jgi:hypothetical protein